MKGVIFEEEREKMAEVISIHSVEDWKKYIEKENTSDKLVSLFLFHFFFVFSFHLLINFKQVQSTEIKSYWQIVVDFTASWCGPCRFMAPTFAELAKEKPHIIFLKVDVDELKVINLPHNIISVCFLSLITLISSDSCWRVGN